MRPFPATGLTPGLTEYMRLLQWHMMTTKIMGHTPIKQSIWSDGHPNGRHLFNRIDNVLDGLSHRYGDAAEQKFIYEALYRVCVKYWHNMIERRPVIKEIFLSIYSPHSLSEVGIRLNSTHDANLTDSDIDFIHGKFVGTFHCVRYAGNNGTTKKSRAVVVSLLDIFNRGSTFGYAVFYKDREGWTEEMHGDVTLIDNHVYMIGTNTTKSTPHIIVTKNRHDEGQDGYNALLYRHTARPQVIAARLVLLPLKHFGTTRKEALSNVGFHSEGTLTSLFPNITNWSNILSRISNNTSGNGKGALSLR